VGRRFSSGTIVRYDRLPPVTSLPELTEPPGYFNREVRQGLSDELAGIERLHRGIASRGI